jgi:glycosyltransferase involved in cell wall biosynthesis
LKWLLVTLDFPPSYVGGVAAWAWDLAHALAASGDRVTVLAQSSPSARAHDQALPFEVVRMRGRSWARWQGTWAAVSGLTRLDAHTTVVAATWRLATGLARWTQRAGARLLVAGHGSDLTRLTGPDEGFQRVVKVAGRWLVVSAFLAGEARRLGVPHDRIRVLPMPLVLDDRPPRTGRQGLVCVARLTGLKGVDRAARLAGALGSSLTVVGDGPARAALEAQTNGLPVRFLGRLERSAAIDQLRRAAAAVLLPRTVEDGSGAEGLGLCLLEAAAQGVPAIGCRTGGVPEAVGPGLILEDPDEPDLSTVRAFLADPQAGARARDWVRATHGPAHCLAVLRAAGPDATCAS